MYLNVFQSKVREGFQLPGTNAFRFLFDSSPVTQRCRCLARIQIHLWDTWNTQLGKVESRRHWNSMWNICCIQVAWRECVIRGSRKCTQATHHFSCLFYPQCSWVSNCTINHILRGSCVIWVDSVICWTQRPGERWLICFPVFSLRSGVACCRLLIKW